MMTEAEPFKLKSVLMLTIWLLARTLHHFASSFLQAIHFASSQLSPTGRPSPPQKIDQTKPVFIDAADSVCPSTTID